MMQWRLIVLLCLAIGVFAVAHAQRSNVQFGFRIGTPGYYNYPGYYSYGYVPYAVPYAYTYPYYGGSYFYPARPGVRVVIRGGNFPRYGYGWRRGRRGGWRG